MCQKNILQKIVNDSKRRVISSIVNFESQQKATNYINNLLINNILPISNKDKCVNNFIDWNVVTIYNQSTTILSNSAIKIAVNQIVKEK